MKPLDRPNLKVRMRLLVLFRGNWTITASVDPDGTCPVKEGLNALEGRTAADSGVFTRRLERLAERGSFQNWEHGHPLEDGIHEIKGKYIRVLYFKDADRLSRLLASRAEGQGEGPRAGDLEGKGNEGTIPGGKGLGNRFGRGGEELKSFEELFAKARESDEYWIEGAKIDFTEGLCREMNRQDVTRAELARRMKVSDAYITKLLRGTTNFTLTTMVRAARAIGREVHIHLAAPGNCVRWFEIVRSVQGQEDPFITATPENHDAERADEPVAA